MKPILILDYGLGNLRSVQKAFEKDGVAAISAADPARIADADKIVLPGVGAFRDAITRLREAGFVEPITDHIKSGKPFLGICLGLQLLFTTSNEDGVYQGLDLFPGEVVKLEATPGLKVPHMGWNQIHVRKPAPIFRDVPRDASVYFVHSYHVKPKDASMIAAETDYPTPFTSAIWIDNVMAVQFHPEKSQSVGLTMLRNFAQL